jgi:hypothetical protein
MIVEHPGIRRPGLRLSPAISSPTRGTASVISLRLWEGGRIYDIVFQRGRRVGDATPATTVTSSRQLQPTHQPNTTKMKLTSNDQT